MTARASLSGLTQPTMIVRPGTRADCEAIAALHAASWRGTYRNILSDDYLDHYVVDDRQDLWAARFAKFDAAQHLVCVAEDNATITGFVCVLLDEEPELGALLDNLHVASASHGQGLGRRLMAAAASWVAAKKPDWAMHLWVYEANSKTVAFYRAMGGSEVEHRVIFTPAGNRAPVLRFVWENPAALGEILNSGHAPRIIDASNLSMRNA